MTKNRTNPDALFDSFLNFSSSLPKRKQYEMILHYLETRKGFRNHQPVSNKIVKWLLNQWEEWYENNYTTLDGLYFIYKSKTTNEEVTIESDDEV